MTAIIAARISLAKKHRSITTNVELMGLMYNEGIIMKFAEKLSKALDIYCLSSAELSVKTGLTPAAISQLKSGKREPMYSTICKVIKVMPVNMRFWFDVS